MKYRFIITGLLLISSFCAVAQRISVEEYIEQYKEIAIREMKRMGVPAAITIAQGILETENGNSELVKKSNNHFGIKCKSSWTGNRVSHDDDATGECFRAYDNAEDSYRDHSNYLRGNKRYESLFGLEPTDYEGWAYGLKKAGYATNPRYPNILIKYIEQYNLQQYTSAGLGEVAKFDASKYEDVNEKNLPADVKDEKVTPAETVGNAPVPGKVITINKTECVFAQKGTSLLAIAVKNNVNLVKLLEFNEMAEDGLLNKDQYIYLRKKPKTGSVDFYMLQPGETIYDVAQKNGIQLQSLKDYNNLNEAEAVPPNTKLFLQPNLKNAGNNAASKIKVHVVAAKEGLYGIAQKYKVSVQQLREWNKLTSNELRVGQELIISK